MNQTFISYPSIENAYREKFVNSIRKSVPDDVIFVVTEKIHGANLSLWTNGIEVKVAKRGSFLGENALKGFYKADQILESNKNKVIIAFNTIKSIKPNVIRIAIYGEIFGGSLTGYSSKNVKSVQSGIQYCPNNLFIAFDIMIETKELLEENEININEFLAYDDAYKILNESEIFCVNPLFRGSFNEVLKWSATNKCSNSTIPYRLDFTYFTSKNIPNEREGHVIRPAVREYNTEYGERVILKDKNPAFLENGECKSTQVKVDEQDVRQEWRGYINLNRLNNVSAKHGLDLTSLNIKELIGRLVSDAIEDITRDFENVQISKQFRAILTNDARELILNMINK